MCSVSFSFSIYFDIVLEFVAFNYFRFFPCFVFSLHPQIISPVSVYIYRAADTDVKHPSLLPQQAQERPAVLKATSALRLWFTGSTVPSSLASCPFFTFLGHRAIPTAQVEWPSLHMPLRTICICSQRKYNLFQVYISSFSQVGRIHPLWFALVVRGRNIHQTGCILSYSRLSPTDSIHRPVFHHTDHGQ